MNWKMRSLLIQCLVLLRQAPIWGGSSSTFLSCSAWPQPHESSCSFPSDGLLWQLPFAGRIKVSERRRRPAPTRARPWSQDAKSGTMKQSLLVPDQLLNIKHISNSPSTVTLTAALVPKGKCTTGKLCPFRRLGKDGCLYIHFSRKKLRCHGLFSINKSKLKNPIVILSFWWPHNLIRYGPFSY